MRVFNHTVKPTNILLNTKVKNVIYLQIAIRTTEEGGGGEVFVYYTLRHTFGARLCYQAPESIELFIEDKASSPSYYLDPPYPVSKLSRFSLPLCRRWSLLSVEGWRGADHMTTRNPGLL